MEKKVTHGVVFIKKINQENNLLMAHSTGNTFWDIPKGGGEEGETPIQSAIREVKEEVGFDIREEELLDIGLFTKTCIYSFILVSKNLNQKMLFVIALLLVHIPGANVQKLMILNIFLFQKFQTTAPKALIMFSMLS